MKGEKNKMAKNIAYFCVEDSRIKTEVDKLKPVITTNDLFRIQDLSLKLGLDYSTGVLCQEGSKMDIEFSTNPVRKQTNHRYDVKREVNIPRAGER